MLTGQRFSTREHGKARYLAEQAFCTQRSADVTGNAHALTDWIWFLLHITVGSLTS